MRKIKNFFSILFSIKKYIAKPRRKCYNLSCMRVCFIKKGKLTRIHNNCYVISCRKSFFRTSEKSCLTFFTPHFNTRLLFYNRSPISNKFLQKSFIIIISTACFPFSYDVLSPLSQYRFS